MMRQSERSETSPLIAERVVKGENSRRTALRIVVNAAESHSSLALVGAVLATVVN